MSKFIKYTETDCFGHDNSHNGWRTVENKKNKKKIRNCNLDKYKTTLCRNTFNKGLCDFKCTCKFAHSIEEQILRGVRKIAYDMIKLDDNLGYINLYDDKDLYEELLKLSNVCPKCISNECFGGYNCRDGVFDPKYQICKLDLVKGHCDNENCNKIHLTKKGLICYETSCMKNIKIPEIIVLSDEYFIKEKKKYKIKKIEKDNLSDDDDMDIFMNFNLDDNDENLVNISIFKIELSLLLS